MFVFCQFSIFRGIASIVGPLISSTLVNATRRENATRLDSAFPARLRLSRIGELTYDFAVQSSESEGACSMGFFRFPRHHRIRSEHGLLFCSFGRRAQLDTAENIEEGLILQSPYGFRVLCWKDLKVVASRTNRNG